MCISKIDDAVSVALSIRFDTFNRLLITFCFDNNGSIGFDPEL